MPSYTPQLASINQLDGDRTGTRKHGFIAGRRACVRVLNAAAAGIFDWLYAKAVLALPDAIDDQLLLQVPERCPVTLN